MSTPTLSITGLVPVTHANADFGTRGTMGGRNTSGHGETEMEGRECP